MAFRLRGLAQALAYRRLIRSLDRLVAAQEQANVLFARLVDRFAPEYPAEVPRPAAATDFQGHVEVHLPAAASDISHLDPDEMQLAQDFVAHWLQHNGHPPTEEQVCTYLAEHETAKLANELNHSRKTPW